MAVETTRAGSKAALFFGLFVGLGFLIAAGLGLALTRYAVDRAMETLHVSNVASKAEGLVAVAERTLASEADTTARLAGSPMVRYRAKKELSRSPELLRAMIFDQERRAVFIGEETGGLMRDAMRRLAARDYSSAPEGHVEVELSPDGQHLIFFAPFKSPLGGQSGLARSAPTPAIGPIGAGTAFILPFEIDEPRVLRGVGRLLADAPAPQTGLTIRYIEPMDAMRSMARWMEQVVSLAIVAGLVIAFTLILLIGRRLILRPQIELARSRQQLEKSEETARRLAMVAEKATDHIAITDRGGRLIWANRALLEGSGYTLEEMIGRSPHEFLLGAPPPPEALTALQRMVETNASVEFRSEIHRKGGDRFLSDVAVTPVPDETGARSMHVIVARDVTEAAQAEERLRNAVNFMDDGFAMVGVDGRIRVVNRAYQDWMAKRGVEVTVGVDYAEFLLDFARKASNFLNGKAPETWRDEFLRTVMEEGREFYLTDSDGATTWRRYRRLPGGELVILATDVSELARARARAEAAVEAKARFSASISHELRTPLIGVISMSELLLESEMTDSQRSGVELIAASGSAMLAIINDILDFSKLEEGRLTLRDAPFDPVELVEDVCALLTAAASAKGLDLVFRFDPDAPRMLSGDAGRLRQIATNLIGNAVKFTAKGRVQVTLRAPRDEAGRARLRIEVEDTGPGVPAADLERIFAPYEQVEGLRVSSAGDGTGLGLAICRQLAELMDGEIGAVSEVGVGSVFHLEARLPISEATEAAQPAAGLMVELASGTPWRDAYEDQLRRLGAKPCEPGEGGPDAIRLVVVGPGGAAPEGALVGSPRRGPSILIVGPDAEPNPESLGHLIEALGEGPSRVLRRPVRSALLARSLGALAGEEPAPARPAQAPREEGAVVMLVEDNDTTAMIVGAMLRGHGLRLRRFAAAAPAVAAQADEPAAVILMDMHLPDMTGPEAARAIRAAEAASGAAPAAILGFTASAEEADHDACLEAGMDGIVTKPVAKDALLAAILERLPNAEARVAAAG